MLKHLELKNVGPAARMKLDFGSRLNLLTGDNGLGKELSAGHRVVGDDAKVACRSKSKAYRGKTPPQRRTGREIDFSFTGKVKEAAYTSTYSCDVIRPGRAQQGRPANPGLVFYAMADGSFASLGPGRTRGPHRTWTSKTSVAYVCSPAEVWDGLRVGERADCATDW